MASGHRPATIADEAGAPLPQRAGRAGRPAPHAAPRTRPRRTGDSAEKPAGRPAASDPVPLRKRGESLGIQTKPTQLSPSVLAEAPLTYQWPTRRRPSATRSTRFILLTAPPGVTANRELDGSAGPPGAGPRRHLHAAPTPACCSHLAPHPEGASLKLLVPLPRTLHPTEGGGGPCPRPRLSAGALHSAPHPAVA